MPGSALNRDELIAGLAALIERLRHAGQPAGIRIVGGAALSLRYFDRRATSDIDARIEPADEVLAIAARIADENGWSHDWLNMSATMFIPTVGADSGWEVIYAEDGIVIEIASPGALLAMKLNASRPTRDRRTSSSSSPSAASTTSRRPRICSRTTFRGTGYRTRRSGSSR
jgi:hypothetical protein